MRTAKPGYKVEVAFDPKSQKYRATSTEIPGLDLTDMKLERLFTKAVKAAPDLLKAAGKPAGDFNLNFEKV